VSGLVDLLVGDLPNRAVRQKAHPLLKGLYGELGPRAKDAIYPAIAEVEP
jgi:hypothetical protein